MGIEGNSYVANNVIDSKDQWQLWDWSQYFSMTSLVSAQGLQPTPRTVIEKYLLKVTLLLFNIIGGILLKCFKIEWVAHCIEALLWGIYYTQEFQNDNIKNQ